MGVLQSIRQRKPVTYPTLKLCEEVVGGFLAYRGRDSSAATWRVFAGGTNQAFLDKHRFDASGLHPRHCPRGVGNSEVLNSHPLCAGLHRPDEFPPNLILGNSESKKEPGLLEPRPSIRLGPLLLWEELTRWAVRVFLLALTLIAARSGRIGERRARRNCHRRYQKERYHEKSKYALHYFSPPLRFS